MEVVWRNSEDIITLSGDPSGLEKFAVDLERQGYEILASYDRLEVTSHGKHIQEIGKLNKFENSLVMKMKITNVQGYHIFSSNSRDGFATFNERNFEKAKTKEQ